MTRAEAEARARRFLVTFPSMFARDANIVGVLANLIQENASPPEWFSIPTLNGARDAIESLTADRDHWRALATKTTKRHEKELANAHAAGYRAGRLGTREMIASWLESDEVHRGASPIASLAKQIRDGRYVPDTTGEDEAPKTQREPRPEEDIAEHEPTE